MTYWLPIHVCVSTFKVPEALHERHLAICFAQVTSFLYFSIIFLYRCTMRIGKGIHPDGVPGWCQGFSLDGGSGVRAVKVIQPGNRPGLIYNIGELLLRHEGLADPVAVAEFLAVVAGINVRKGKGRYRDSHIVTFAPRYLLDNRSSHKLAFSQREFARGKVSVGPCAD